MRLCLQSQEGGNFERKEGGTRAIKKTPQRGTNSSAAAFLTDIEIKKHGTFVYKFQIITFVLFYSKKRGVSAYFSHIKVGIVQTLVISGSLFTGFCWFVVLPILSLQDKNKLSAHSHS